MEKHHHIYETTFIVNASLDDAQIENVIARVADTITKNGGTITMNNRWGRKRLAYPINKKTNGYYVTLEFEGPGEVPNLLERAFGLDEMILRHLIIKLDSNALKARAAARARAAQEPQPPAEVPAREPLFDDAPPQTTN